MINKEQKKQFILTFSEHDKIELLASYMPFLVNGGIFVPTDRECELGEEISLVLALMDDVDAYVVIGKIVWVTPVNAHYGRKQGVGISFPEDQHGDDLKMRIESLLGVSVASSHLTHTL